MEEIPEKIIVVGDISTGKTSLICRFVNNEYDEQTEPTLGSTFTKQSITFGDKILELRLYDTSGDERFRSLTQMYFRGSKCVLLMIDLGNRESFNSIDYWIGVIHSYSSPNIPIILVGTKSDLPRWEVTEKELQTIAKKNKISCMITSAKNNVNVKETFELAGKLAYNYDVTENDSYQTLNTEEQKKIREDLKKDTITSDTLFHSQHKSYQPEEKRSFFSFCSLF